MRSMVKRLLKKYKYPPEGQAEALETVISQCEMWSDNAIYTTLPQVQPEVALICKPSSIKVPDTFYSKIEPEVLLAAEKDAPYNKWTNKRFCLYSEESILLAVH